MTPKNIAQKVVVLKGILNWTTQTESDYRYPKKEDNSGVYDYVIEKIASTYYARPSASSSLTAYSGAVASTVINSAITAIASGGKIYIKPGIYDITTPILIENTNNIKIEGSGWNKTTFTSVGGGGVIYQVIELRGICDNIEISGIGITSTVTNATNQTNTSLIYAGAYAAGLVDIQLSNINIHDCSFTNPNVNMNAVFMTVGTTNAYLKDFSFTNNYIRDVGRCGIELIDHIGTRTFENVTKLNISDNTIVNTGTQGTYGIGISLGIDHIDFPATDITISGNTIKELRKNQAIEVAYSERVVVRGNKITNTTYHVNGITVTKSQAVTLTNNVIDLADPDSPATRSTPSYPLTFNLSNNVSVTGNYVKGNQVTITDSNNITITGNNIKTIGYYAFQFFNTSQFNKITANTIDCSRADAVPLAAVYVSATGTAYNEITDNILVGTPTLIFQNGGTSVDNLFELSKPISISSAIGTTAILYPGSQFVNVTSSDANRIIVLPEASAYLVGIKVRGKVGATGFELRVATSQASTVYLNNVTTNVEAAIPANTLFEVELVDATHWVLKAWTMLGAPITPIIPDAN